MALERRRAVTVDALGALVGVLAAVNVVLIRLLWRLSNRISRLEGRFNGHRDE